MASSRNFQVAVLFGLAAVALSGCGGSDSQSSSSTGTAATTPSTTTTTTTQPSTGSTKTTVAISGTPATSIKVGQKYAFAPKLSAKGSAQFTIKNKPSWASFDATSGALSGTPGAKDVGTTKNVQITAALNGTSAALDAFDVTVQASAQTSATAPVTLSWVAPSSGNPDGYRIYYGTSANSLTHSVTLTASETSYVVNNLASGTWYFAMTSLDANDVESSKSAVIATEI